MVANSLSRIVIVVPVFNAEGHLIEFLDNLAHLLERTPFECRVLIIDDFSSDDTARICRDFIAARDGAIWTLKLNSSRQGQQLTLAAAMREIDLDEVALLVDDDIAIDVELLKLMCTPIIEGQTEVVVAQHRAKGLRRLTSAVFWRLHRGLSANRSTGRDLMLRALAPNPARIISNLVSPVFSVAQATDLVAMSIFRVSPEPTFLRVKSRYSALDRFWLFVDLIVIGRKQIGYFLITMAALLSSGFLTGLIVFSLLGYVEFFSESSLLALGIVGLGALNLLGLGILQVGIAIGLNREQIRSGMRS